MNLADGTYPEYQLTRVLCRCDVQDDTNSPKIWEQAGRLYILFLRVLWRFANEAATVRDITVIHAAHACLWSLSSIIQEWYNDMEWGHWRMCMKEYVQKAAMVSTALF